MRSKLKKVQDGLKTSLNLHVLIALAFCVPVILSRLFVLVFSVDFHFSSPVYIFYIFRGIVSDLIPTFLSGYVISFIPRRMPWGFIIYLLWIFTCIVSGANAEHVIVNLGNIDFRYSGLGLTSVMLKGSVVTTRVILLVTSIFILSLVIIYIARMYINKINGTPWRRSVIYKSYRVFSLLIILWCSLLILPADYSIITCIQMGMVEENILKTWYNTYSTLTKENIPLDEKTRHQIFGKDLDGKLLLDRPSKKYNVLLILLESIGQETLESGMMPKLNDLMHQGMYFPRYLISQKQTNRGMYNILCGDYPNMITYKAKASQLKYHLTANKNHRPCLPGVLRNAGYHTTFLQSAPLQFMHKDQFIPHMGFEESQGDGSFKKIYGRAGWGVDDRTLYYATLDKMKILGENAKPWFITLLTVGTHHPNRPVEGAASNYETAVRYADNAIAEFYSNAEKMKLLENTIIVLTTDESHGPLGDGTIPLIARNHGIMAVLFPPGSARKSFRAEGLFAAHDFELSMVDYLGLSTQGMMGRSLFREYAREERSIIFGHTYAGIFYYLSDKRLNVCNYDFVCSYYELKGDFLTDTTFKFGGYEHDTRTLKAIIQYNDWRD